MRKRKQTTPTDDKRELTPSNNRRVVKKKKKFVFHSPSSRKKQKVAKQDRAEMKVKIDSEPATLDKEESFLDTTIEKEIDVPKNKTDDEPSPKKRSSLLQRDMKGKPVFLEDTGEKLGIVYDMMYDDDHHCIGYKIKDSKTNSVLSFPLEQFDEDKSGLIFLPSWYTKSLKTIEKFEFKDRITPDLTTVLADDLISYEELQELFIQHDEELASFLKEARTLHELLEKRLRVLEKQRLALKDNLLELTEKRLIKDIDRKEFSEDVLEHRRKAHILDINIEKTKKLLDRLNDTSFGNLSSRSDLKRDTHLTDEKKQNNQRFDTEASNQYKEKYQKLQLQYSHLEQEYKELKTAVEKLMGTNKYLDP